MALATLPENSFPFDQKVISERVWGVLKELQNRQQILLEIKSLELKWRLLFLGGCSASILALLARGYAIKLRMLPTSLILLFFLADCLVFFRLRKLQSSSQKALVNFGVLRHHLIGMIEVGLCSCTSDCDCKERFRRQALKEFRVNLY